ncbi:MAG: RIP metalloprotease RseP [Zoogloeaceae bacterium]|nr:RIP metalloprotease RseP [Zoogloeaceae bacterium]
MNILDYLVPFAVGLGLLIAIHEFGHYWVARRCGVKVLRFSIGFGRPILRWRAGSDGTEWAIGLFPLGGYVKMLDEREAPVAAHELHRAFNRQTVGRRMAIVAAGPLANLILAILIYWGMNLIGTEELRPRVGLLPGPTAAVSAGFEEADEVRAVAGEPISSWQDFRWAILRHALDAGRVDIQVERDRQGIRLLTMDLAGFDIDEGGRDFIARIGFRPFRPVIPAEVGRLVEAGPAARAGIEVGDKILAIDGEPVLSWEHMVERIRPAAGRVLEVEIQRHGSRLSLAVTPEAAPDGKGESVGRIGIAVAEEALPREDLFTTVQYGPVDGLARAVRQTWETSSLSLSMMGRMLVGEVSWKNLSGPVTIADYAGQSARMGWDHYLKFLALISISLGVLNLLPIPVLDGGHLLYYSIELIKGGPIPERLMEIGQQVGLALLVMLMAFAFYNDITRLISS